jgi:HAD superfamily hydrolase (TIGR01549 family)
MVRPEWVGQIEAIGWDLDGTLYPNVEGLGEEIKRLRREAVAEALGVAEGEADDKFRQVYEELGSHTKAMDKLGIAGEEFFTGMWDRIELEKYIKPDPGISELFGKLEGYRHFLLSNSNRRDQMERKLGLIGLDPKVFEFMQETVGLLSVKPEPRAFEVCLEKLGLPANRVMYVGDRDSTDMKGAKGVGVWACMVWNESQVADVVCGSVYDVAELFI